jgi:dTDP-4-dehydrorhamnose reductase
MLGSDVVRAARLMNHEVLPVTHEELDVRDAKAVEAAFVERYPHAIVNCAAWTDVDGAEDDPEGAMEVNRDGARNVAASAAALRVPVVYPSTDYVFDGSRGEPYIESDETDPQSEYGRSKLAGEIATAHETPAHFIVRTSWLFGVGGQNFVESMLSLASELGEVLVVMDQIGCPTYTGHLAQAIVGLLDGDMHGVHHIAGAGECSWYEFAIFRMAKADCRVMAATTDMVPRRAQRPAYSVLDTEREHPILLPDWHEGLEVYLADRSRTLA